MKIRHKILNSLANLSLFLALTSGGISVAQNSSHQFDINETDTKILISQAETNEKFHFIAQPLWLKGTVTLAGISLIGLEVWWFLFSKNQKRS
ncbi:MAG: hypothetical protein SAJ37_23730 [Oscillatoria sp. PMC 1068.18]|nr:hypothetical protein [Oscillatoria sp. PMC 1076.18]MEC4991758.1 hypothetical protein [Oscillatoria sp. PMC 1068.18]